MKIFNHNRGRLGNSIFRLMANIVFLIVYDIDGEIVYNNLNYTKVISDDYFSKWADNILNNKIDDTIDKNSILYFDGFYQHDKIYSYFRPKIIDYLKNHPNLFLLTHVVDNYKVSDLFHTINKKYDIVIHLRLEDFLQINQVLNPLTICKIIDENININNNKTSICLVLNKATNDIEFKYIEYFKNKYNITVESNDPITDFHIMKNAETLICSYSTLSWCAAFFSDSVKQVYIPNYNISLHQTFKTLQHTNVTLYNCDFCNFERLSLILTINKSYSLTDCLGKPIDFKLDELFNKKTDGFYIELGAFDGLSQSNTAFFEFYRNWKGILIEPSFDSFNSCLKNRPNSFTINACCVSNDYTEETILGDFNSITMASVNGLRLNNSKDKLVRVKAITLEKILDEYFIKNGEKEIDFISIDTEGYELEVIKGLNLNKYKPKYLLIEIYTNDFNNICEFLNNHNYILHSNFTNYNKFNNPIWDGTHNDFLFYVK